MCGMMEMRKKKTIKKQAKLMSSKGFNFAINEIKCDRMDSMQKSHMGTQSSTAGRTMYSS